MRRGAQTVHVWIAAVMVAAVVVQIFLAGYGIFSGRTSNLDNHAKIVETSTLDAHRLLGSLIVPVALVLVIAAAAAGYRGRDMAMSGILLLLVVVQMFLAGLGADTGAAFGGLHAVNALAIAGLSGQVLARSRRALRAPTAPA
jgi:uncharacterized membrane protein